MKAQTTQTHTLFKVIFDREDDGRWIAEIPKLPGVMVYGGSKRDALRKVYVLALRTLADRVEQGRMMTPVSRWFDYDLAHH